jgi:hypothetical protein
VRPAILDPAWMPMERILVRYQDMGLIPNEGDPESYPKNVKDNEIDILPIAVIGLIFLIMVAAIFLYNNGYISIFNEEGNEDQKRIEMREISIADDKKNQGLKIALKNLEKDFKHGSLNEEAYYDLKRIYETKIYK